MQFRLRSPLPEYRKKGYAEKLINELISDAKTQGKKGVVLTCKDVLVSYYEKFGFENEGVSESTHGGVVWYAMRLKFLDNKLIKKAVQK